MEKKDPWPSEIRLKKDRRSLLVRFDDGVEYDLPAEYLRVLSPSAEVQGHSAEQRQTVGGKIDVAIAAVDPVGNYAVRLTFSDRHDSGIYSWPYLRKLGDEREALWAGYVRDLEAKGMSRTR
ncbi:MAG TPA: DUF971 domain-containing protein [Bauldia sp.]|nr:DUF971 domain-containing protein [Bauldia sp.]